MRNINQKNIIYYLITLVGKCFLRPCHVPGTVADVEDNAVMTDKITVLKLTFWSNTLCY